MAEVVVDIVDGSVVKDSLNLYEARRRAIVSGLTPTTPDAMVFQAMNEPGVPPIFTSHPSIPFIYALERNARAVDTDIVEVEIVYRVPDPIAGETEPNAGVNGQIQVGSSLTEIQTNLDRAGLNIKASYTPPGGLGPDEKGSLVSKSVPQTVVRYTRVEPSSPGDNSIAYVGKLNSVGVFSDPPEYWMCTAIDGDSRDGGISYTVSYEFVRLGPDRGRAYVAYIDPETDEPPVDAILGNGITPWPLYDTIDFNGLGI